MDCLSTISRALRSKGKQEKNSSVASSVGALELKSISAGVVGVVSQVDEEVGDMAEILSNRAVDTD